MKMTSPLFLSLRDKPPAILFPPLVSSAPAAARLGAWSASPLLHNRGPQAPSPAMQLSKSPKLPTLKIEELVPISVISGDQW